MQNLTNKVLVFDTYNAALMLGSISHIVEQKIRLREL